uniref:Uncharacterized protein n=1 Tax=Glossina pallidipes TaxID=7398 RepID=A0A1A9ZFG7_GLOPL
MEMEMKRNVGPPLSGLLHRSVIKRSPLVDESEVNAFDDLPEELRGHLSAFNRQMMFNAAKRSPETIITEGLRRNTVTGFCRCRLDDFEMLGEGSATCHIFYDFNFTHKYSGITSLLFSMCVHIRHPLAIIQAQKCFVVGLCSKDRVYLETVLGGKKVKG